MKCQYCNGGEELKNPVKKVEGENICYWCAKDLLEQTYWDNTKLDRFNLLEKVREGIYEY